MNAETAAAIKHYDHMRAAHSERTSRVAAEQYLRRKLPGLDATGAAIELADALAIRAYRKLLAARVAITGVIEI